MWSLVGHDKFIWGEDIEAVRTGPVTGKVKIQ